MLTRFTYHSSVAHGDAAGRKQRNLIALAKGLQNRNLLNGLDIKLREFDNGCNLVCVLKILGRKLTQNLSQATAELIKLIGLYGYANSARMTSKANKQVGTFLDSIKQID